MVEGANKGTRLLLKVELSLLITALQAVIGVERCLLVLTTVLVMPPRSPAGDGRPSSAPSVSPLAATVSSLVVIGTIKAECLLSLPSLGWCLAVGWHHPEAARNLRPPLAQRTDRRKPGPR